METRALRTEDTLGESTSLGYVDENALFAVADGAIIGQWLKQDGRWWNPVDPRRVEALMEAVAKVRKS